MQKQGAFDLINGEIPNDTESAFQLLDPHKLAPWFYFNNRQFFTEFNKAPWEAAYQQQSLKNLSLLNELSNVEQEVPVVRLKGTSFIYWLYQDIGERHLTDADLLVDEKDLPEITSYLAARGYQSVPQVKWSANKHRFSFIKNSDNGMHYEIDLHTKLHWQQSKTLKPEIINPDGYSRLSNPWLFYHLCMNWIFQDTFVGLNKLIDIKNLIAVMDPQEFLEGKKLLKRAGYKSVLNLALTVIEPSSVDKHWLLNRDFLNNPKAHLARYLALKQLNKKSGTQALKYNLDWASAYLKNLERP